MPIHMYTQAAFAYTMGYRPYSLLNSVKIGFVTLDRKTLAAQNCDKCINNVYLLGALDLNGPIYRGNRSICVPVTNVNVTSYRFHQHTFACHWSFPNLRRKRRRTITIRALWAFLHPTDSEYPFLFVWSNAFLAFRLCNQFNIPCISFFERRCDYTLREIDDRSFLFSVCTVSHCSRLQKIRTKIFFCGKRIKIYDDVDNNNSVQNVPGFPYPSRRKVINLTTWRSRAGAAIPSAWVPYQATVTDHSNATRSSKESTSLFVDGTPLPNPLQSSFWSCTSESAGTPLRILATPIGITVPRILGCWRFSNYSLQKRWEEKVNEKGRIFLR